LRLSQNPRTLRAPEDAERVETNAPAAADRQGMMLQGPILPALVKLALPTTIVLLVQALVGVIETYFVSFLGADALTGTTLVLPALMLMQTMSNGGIGGGVAAAVAQALGAGRKADANALVLHALIIALACGIAFSTIEFLAGRMLYHALGGEGRALAAALNYGHVVFGGACLVWGVSLLAAVLRGTGNVAVPAAVTLGSVFVVLPLSPALIFGIGAIPGLGIPGAGLAVLVYYVLALVVLIAYLRSGRSVVRLSMRPSQLEWRLFADVLRVGGLAAIGNIQSNLTVALVTGAVGLFGIHAIAGYGIASRLDYLLIPLIFGLGSAALTMIGTNIGAGEIKWAERVIWISALVAAALTEAIGVVAAVFPQEWLGLFTAEPDVLASGSLYLRTVAPFYGFVGGGLLLYFAGQGAGKVGWPAFAGLVRLIVAAAGGWYVASRMGGGLDALFHAVAIASIAYGVIPATALLFTGLVPRRRSEA
jgi:putative MATE family efflux protein